MLTRWQRAALDGIRRYSARHRTRLIRRAAIVEEELPVIVHDAGANAERNDQTLSRVLQELRRAGILHHVRSGVDLLLDEPIDVETEDLPDGALDVAIEHDQLRMDNVPTGNTQVLARRRKGQARLRQLTLVNYGGQCALCDIRHPELLVLGHIARWSDNREAQGRLSNALCLCGMHDVLFEKGYIALADDCRVLVKHTDSAVVKYLQNTANTLRLPKSHPPCPKYLQEHRLRTGHEYG